MSVGPLGIIGGLAGTPGGLKPAATDRAQQDSAQQDVQAAAQRQSEKSAGIGQLSEEQHAADRDADGRRMWEHPRHASQETPTPEAAAHDPSSAGEPRAPDASGTLGAELDLSG